MARASPSGRDLEVPTGSTWWYLRWRKLEALPQWCAGRQRRSRRRRARRNQRRLAIGSTGNGWANNYAGGIDEVAILQQGIVGFASCDPLLGRQSRDHRPHNRQGGQQRHHHVARGSTLQEATSIDGAPSPMWQGRPTSPLIITGNRD